MSDLQVMKGVAYTEKRLMEWLQEDGKVVVQTKRDEIRCIVEIHGRWSDEHSRFETHVTYTSASGKPLYNLECYDQDWMDFYKRTGKKRIDTGVAVNDSFDLTRRTVTASKKQYHLKGACDETIYEGREPDPGRPGKFRNKVYYQGPLKAVFWLYDIIDHAGTYADRRIHMAKYAKEYYWMLGCPETFIVEVQWGDSLTDAVAEVNSLFESATGAGHEGLMVKRFYYFWEPRRTTHWMKMKPKGEVDVRIVGWVPGKDGFEGMVGSLIGEAEDGSTVSFSGFTLELRKELTKDVESFYGRWAEVRFMQRDSKGGYRHPAFYRWHPDK